jgi:hypothetical protein
MTTDLPALIARVEAATGADRELDDMIAIAVGIPATIKLGDEMLGNVRWAPVRSKPYTASLDAAVSLVPSGCLWTLDCLSNATALYRDARYQANAATPALALCAAALRARQAMEGGDHG